MQRRVELSQSSHSPGQPVLNARVLTIVTRWEVGGVQETVIELHKSLAGKVGATLYAAGVTTESDETGARIAEAEGLPLARLEHMQREVSLVADIRALFEIRRLIKGFKPDIVHMHASKAGILGRVATLGRRSPCLVYTVHGWSFAKVGGLKARAYVWLERALARRTHVLFVVAETDRELGLTHKIGSQDTYRVVRSAIDLSRFRKPDQERVMAARELAGVPAAAKNVVGTVTRLADLKDPITLAETLGSVLDSDATAHAVVVGDGPRADEFSQRLVDIGVRDRVSVLGLRRDVEDLLPCFDVFLLTDEAGGLPRAIVEALASGIPVVSTDFAGVGEAVRDGATGLLRPVGDVAALSDAIVELLHDTERQSAMSDAAVVDAAQFSSATMATLTLDEYIACTHISE